MRIYLLADIVVLLKDKDDASKLAPTLYSKITLGWFIKAYRNEIDLLYQATTKTSILLRNNAL